ncbi:MAG: hypothetical protein MZU97_02430 [Bacillus subtilis]|nr:hypothetical protein [Bacillus subtilis]
MTNQEAQYYKTVRKSKEACNMNVEYNFDSKSSVGLVKTQYYTFDEPIELESGLELSPVTIAYETYGKLNEKKDNAILLFRSFRRRSCGRVSFSGG